jgi:hypothetical protein
VALFTEARTTSVDALARYGAATAYKSSSKVRVSVKGGRLSTITWTILGGFMEHSIIDNAPWERIDEQVRTIVRRQKEIEQEQAEKAALFDTLYLIGPTEYKNIWLNSYTHAEFNERIRAAGQAISGGAV